MGKASNWYMAWYGEMSSILLMYGVCLGSVSLVYDIGGVSDWCMVRVRKSHWTV